MIVNILNHGNAQTKIPPPPQKKNKKPPQLTLR